MQKKDFLHKGSICYILVFGVYIIVHWFCLIKTSDDLMWDNIDSLSQMLRSCNPNGRYFTNILTYFMCNSYFICFIVYTFFMGAFLFLIAKLFSDELNYRSVSALFAGVVLLLSPRYFYVHIFNWISGFPNYVISLIFLLIYIRFCFPVFEKKPMSSSRIAAFLFFVIGFLGALCIENITIYALVLSIFILIFVLVTQKKVYFSNAAYLIGNVIGTFVMMSNGSYKQIAQEGDDIAFRSFEFSLIDIFMKIYREIINNFFRPYFGLHIIISICIIALFLKKYRDSEKRPKYSFVSIAVIIAYSVFSFVASNGDDIAVLTEAYRSRAIETAFTFIYIISLIYMVCTLFDGGKRIRALIYLLSTIVVTAPFIVVNSITGRCFFASFVFLCLFTFELAVPVVNDISAFELGISKKFSLIAVSSLLGLNLFMDISNKCVDIIRIDYIKRQLAEDARQIELIKLPYQKNCFDPITLFTENDLYLNKDGKKYSYTELYCINNGIDLKILDKATIYIDMRDYHPDN